MKDETYLEAFIESISTLPSELRRNLCHIRSLDQSCRSIVSQLREEEENYVQRAHEIIASLPVEERQANKRQKIAGDENEAVLSSKSSQKPCTTKKDGDQSSSTTKIDDESKEDEERNSDKNGDNDYAAIGDGKSKEKETPENNNNNGDNDESTSSIWTDPKYGIPVTTTEGEKVLVVPTTEELRAKIRNPEAEVEIANLRRLARQHADEKVAAADQTYAIVDAAVKRLDADLEKFESLLKGAGCFETSPGAQPDDLAAIQVTPNSPDWILAKVISHDTTSGMYKLSDEDIESNKTFTLPESQVVILGGVDRLSKGDTIYAVYPDTTSFYQATVVQAPRKVAGGGESFVTVHFKDDGDEHGITHDKAVLMKHVMRVPYGAMQ